MIQLEWDHQKNPYYFHFSVQLPIINFFMSDIDFDMTSICSKSMSKSRLVVLVRYIARIIKLSLSPSQFILEPICWSSIFFYVSSIHIRNLRHPNLLKVNCQILPWPVQDEDLGKVLQPLPHRPNDIWPSHDEELSQVGHHWDLLICMHVPTLTSLGRSYGGYYHE